MDVDVLAMVVVMALALAVLALIQPVELSSPSLSAIYRYWPQYYNYTIHGDVAALRPLLSGLTCWLYADGSWVEISRSGGLGLSISVLNLTCR
ncbi:MAG: type II/IV secretion system protein [Thermoproteus sp.]